MRVTTLGLVALIAGGCATRASVQDLRQDLSRVRTEVTEVRLAQDLVSSDLARVLAELRSLDARTDEAQERLRVSSSDLGRLHARLQATEDDLRKGKAAAPRPSITIVHPPSVATPSPVVTPPASLPAAPDAERSGDVVGDEPAERAYAAALNTFRAREHGQAVLDFMGFIAKYPKHTLAPNAQYWIGEAYYAQRDYRHALVEFQRVVEMAPRVPKAADALLRMGMCHASLREAAPAAETWQRVVRDYPRSEAAAKARSFLQARGATR